MLNAMREGAKSGVSKLILFGFMVMAVGGMVFMDVGGFFRGGVNQNAVAKIGSEDLPIVTFDRTLNRVLANQGLDPQTAYRLGLIEQVLRNEISNNLLNRAATDLGLEVGNAAVLKQVNRLIEPLVTDEMSKKEALSIVLRNQGMTERDFIRMIQAEMANTLLRNAFVLGGGVAPEKAAAALYQYENEERTVKAVYLPHSGIKDIDEPTDEVLLPFYQAGQERYAVPETRLFSVAILSQDKLEKTLDVSDEELREIYDRDIANYSVPEQRLLEQAILDDQGKADAVAEAFRAGKPLKEAVASETGNEDSYLGEETFEKEGLLKELAEDVFTAKKGDVLGPIESALGWHVIKLKKVIEPATDSFAKVKKDLKKEIIHLRVADEMFNTANAIDDQFAGGASLEEVAEEMELTIETYGPVKRDGSTTDNKDGMKAFGPDWAYVLETAFDLLEGEISPVFELADGRYAALRVDTINEKSYKPFEEVKEDLAKVWIQDQKEVANKLRAQEAIRDINNGNKNLTEVASAHGAQIKTHKLVRSKDASAPLDNNAKTLFFALPEGQHSVGAVKGGYIIGQVTSTKLPSTEKLSDEKLKPIIEKAQRGEQNEFTQLYLSKLYEDYSVKINARLLETTYGPGSEQY